MPLVHRHVETFESVGRPTAYAGEENERKWKQAVRDAIDAKQPFLPPLDGARLAVRIEFASGSGAPLTSPTRTTS